MTVGQWQRGRRAAVAAGWALATIVSAGCQDAAGPGGGGTVPPVITALPRTLTSGERLILDAGNRFSFPLLARVNQQHRGKNVFMSPLSASMALGMTMMGAGGETFDEMRTTLGFGTASREEIAQSYRDLIAMLRGLDPTVDFRIANSIWYRDAFAPFIQPTFLATTSAYFDAVAAGLDFSSPGAVARINEWVKNATNGKIDSIIERIGPEIVMFLINAIYFKGDWRQGFDAKLTTPGVFRTDDGRTVTVPFMTRTDTMRATLLDGRTIVDLGYGGDAFAMTAILPRSGETADALVASLSPAWCAQATGALRSQSVQLTLPRFKMQWDSSLTGVLQDMGMRKAFSPRVADFTPLSATLGRSLFISFVRQRTFVDVNEVGTEAAAVTIVGVGVVSLPQRLVARFDRPFVFAIRERLSGAILFIGKVAEPGAT